MSITDPPLLKHAILIGGPRDGMELAAEFVGQPIIRTPEPPPLASRLTDAHYPGVMRVSIYSLQIDPTGHASRDDTGRLRYRYTGAR